MILLCLAVVACSRPADVPTPEKKSKLVVMTFNVENLFDTHDDPEKVDETFLPATKKKNEKHLQGCMQIKVEKWRRQCTDWDWSEKVLQTKLDRIGQVIRSVNQGNGPDILFLQEVENKSVLERLRKSYLNGLKYRESLLLEGKDARGIDVAILSRYPFVKKAELLPIEFSRDTNKKRIKDTREILFTSVKVKGEEINLYSVHFPAPFHPTTMREAAFRSLNKYLEQDPQLSIAAGDFNVTSSEDKEKRILSRLATDNWKVSHLEGCKGCPGSNYYAPRKQWSFLDMVLVSKEGLKKSSWSLVREGIRLANKLPFQNRQGTPYAFKMPGAKGLSDHWPVVLELEWSPPAKIEKN